MQQNNDDDMAQQAFGFFWDVVRTCDRLSVVFEPDDVRGVVLLCGIADEQPRNRYAISVLAGTVGGGDY